MSQVATAPSVPAGEPSAKDRMLFWACFAALIATSFGFILRALNMDAWQAQFGLSATQMGEIFGAGLWPFAISIILFSLVIDKIGYGKAMVFAFVCHIASAIITISACLTKDPKTAYWTLYVGNFVVALANGTVEAVINPVVATMFNRDKVSWLNKLHAGWPGGLVLGGLLALAAKHFGIAWQYQIALILLPTVFYGIMMPYVIATGGKFPIQERVTAGVGFREMLAEAGFIGALIATYLIVSELVRVAMGFMDVTAGDWAVRGINLAITLVICVPYGLYVKSLGRALFIFLLLVMIPLATTELGVDSWVTNLMGPEMEKIGIQAGWVLVYTSFIMMMLRFAAGAVVHRISPLGLLAIAATIAAIGLVSLSAATGAAILVAATLYALGKTFFWPTMLGIVSERFPRGGALTLNTMGGVGMLGVGVVGAVLLGNIQDKQIDKDLSKQNQAIHAKVTGEQQLSVFGTYKPIDEKKLTALPAADKKVVTEIQGAAKKNALKTVAIFPCIMLACYIGLILYFKGKGGYKAVHIEEAAKEGAMAGAGKH